MMLSRSDARFRAALTALTCGALLLTLRAPAARADDGRHGSDRSDLRVCDLSACYLALQVVDSDGDGTADADEITLGSDPLDPASRPLLRNVLDATLDGKLPTYELGYGTWAVFPSEFVAGLEKKWYAGAGSGLPSEVFGIPTRRDSFALAGIDDGLLKSAGLDMPWVTGLSFGLFDSDGSGKNMKIDLGRFDPSWYGNFDDSTGIWAAAHGGQEGKTVEDGETTVRGYIDGSSSRSWPSLAGCENICTTSGYTEYYDSDLNLAATSTDEVYQDLTGRWHHDQTVRDANGTVLKEVRQSWMYHNEASQRDTTDTQKGAGTAKEHTQTRSEDDGTERSSTNREKCDEKGENCTGGMTTGDEDSGRVLPGTAWLSHKVAAAAMGKLLTGRGTTVLPAQNAPDVIGVWTDDDVKAVLHKRDLISLFSGDEDRSNVGPMVVGTGWNTANPETRPDLPSPLDGAPGSGAGGCASGGTC
jgi:hypothetical protein